MAINFDGVGIEAVNFDAVAIDKVTIDGVTVWTGTVSEYSGTITLGEEGSGFEIGFRAWGSEPFGSHTLMQPDALAVRQHTAVVVATAAVFELNSLAELPDMEGLSPLAIDYNGGEFVTTLTWNGSTLYNHADASGLRAYFQGKGLATSIPFTISAP